MMNIAPNCNGDIFELTTMPQILNVKPELKKQIHEIFHVVEYSNIKCEEKRIINLSNKLSSKINSNISNIKFTFNMYSTSSGLSINAEFETLKNRDI